MIIINLRNYFRGLVTYEQLKQWAENPMCEDIEIKKYIQEDN